jgi:hypothetical protein
MWKKLFNRSWTVLIMIAGLFFSLLFIVLLFLIIGTLGSSEALEDSKIINTIGLLALCFALPPSLEQLLKMFIDKKMRFKVNQSCPKCRHKIEYQIEED